MSSEVPVSAFINHLMSMPFFREAVGPDSGSGRTNRFIIINPVTQAMVVVGGADFGSLFNGKEGEPPASKAEIEGLKSIELKSCQDVESVGGECVICLEEYKVGDVAKEMPCQHKFHGECVDTWLKIHGTCPVCRFKVGSDDDVDGKSDDVESERTVRREVWLEVSVRSSLTVHPITYEQYCHVSITFSPLPPSLLPLNQSPSNWTPPLLPLSISMFYK